jgi:hypothetical protein
VIHSTTLALTISSLDGLLPFGAKLKFANALPIADVSAFSKALRALTPFCSVCSSASPVAT